MNETVRKYLIRIGVAILIHFFFHVNNVDNGNEIFPYAYYDMIVLVSLIFVVLGIWEIQDLAFRYFDRHHYDYGKTNTVIKIVVIMTALTLPMVILASIVIDLVLMPYVGCPCDPNVIRSILQGQVLSWLIVSSKLIRVRGARMEEIEKEKALIQKNLLVSQYENLKNQINPHFLFNSFSVLRSLIETDPKLADEFLSKLAKLYRYILDNDEESMKPLHKELIILNDFVFLLKIRHRDSINVQIDIPEAFLDCYIPSLSLQMLIENAIKHNRFSDAEPLNIRIFAEDEYLVIRNQVNKNLASVSSTRIGLENIKSRYEFQTSSPVLIEHSSGLFTVKMPMLSSVRLA